MSWSRRVRSRVQALLTALLATAIVGLIALSGTVATAVHLTAVATGCAEPGSTASAGSSPKATR